MSRWRKIVERKLLPDAWLLQLECGHEAYRSAQLSAIELPAWALCNACRSLMGMRIKDEAGKIGTITDYHGGEFDISWQNDGVTRSTLDKLREQLEIL